MPGNASRNLEMYISAFLGVDLRSQIVKIHLRSHLFMNVGSFPSTSNVLIEDRPERFPLTCSNVELFRGGLTTSISTSNLVKLKQRSVGGDKCIWAVINDEFGGDSYCAGTPRRSTQNFGVISQIGVCVSKRNKNYSMMGKERYGLVFQTKIGSNHGTAWLSYSDRKAYCQGGGLVSPVLRSGAGEDAGKLRSVWIDYWRTVFRSHHLWSKSQRCGVAFITNLAIEACSLPKSTSHIEECRKLSRSSSISGRKAK
jgi:hypothetical protein